MFPLLFSLFLGTVMITGQPASNTDAEQTAVQEESIGTVVELTGSASAVSSKQSARELGEGDSIYLNDTITTSTNTSLQIEFLDESLFTLSEKTILKIDEYIYDSSAQKGEFGTSVAKGIFRYVSGKIEKINPEKVNIEIPSGTIGIRGTIVVGEIDGENCLVALEPEEGNTPHKIVVFNEREGQRQEIEITKPGFATRIEGRGKAPQPIFQLPQDKQQQFQQRLPQAPQFPQGTRPGTPERYQHLFNPNERMMKQADGKMPQGEKREGTPINQKEERRQNFGGPNGPNGPNGFNGPNSGVNGPNNPNGLARNGNPFNPQNQNEGKPFQGSPQQGFQNSQNFQGPRPQGEMGPRRENNFMQNRPFGQMNQPSGQNNFQGNPKIQGLGPQNPGGGAQQPPQNSNPQPQPPPQAARKRQ